MQHLKWTTSGRLFSHTDEGKPNQFTWKSSIGQRNVDLGGGNFAPYFWNVGSKVVRFGECELRFTVSGLEFWRGTEKLNTLSFNPEYKQGTTWRRRSLAAGNLSIQEIDSGGSKVELKISYTITTQDSITEIFVRAGYNHKVHFGVHFKALKSGVEQRVSLDFAELFTPVEEKDLQGNALPTARLKTAKSWWAWDRKEQSTHELEQTTITKVHLGRKVYALNEEITISPDTWGTDVGIAATEDDGEEREGVTNWDADGYWGGGRIYVGNVYEKQHLGFRWDNITIPQGATIDSAIVDLYTGEDYGGTPTSKFYAWDTDDALQFDNTTNYPSGVAKTAANVDWNPASGVGWKNITVPAIVQEIVDRVGWLSGNAINFAVIATNSSGGNQCDIQDFSSAGTYEAEFTITYTAGAAGGIPPITPFHRPFARPLGGPL